MVILMRFGGIFFVRAEFLRKKRRFFKVFFVCGGDSGNEKIVKISMLLHEISMDKPYFRVYTE